jgi:NADPH:quinone reductase-like Zn-dependent oxidoreductase
VVKGFGAEEVIDYRKTDFTQLGKRWDLIFDVSAKSSFGHARKALESSGVYVTTISGMGHMLAPLLNPLRSKKARFVIVKGSVSDLDYVRSLIESGKLKVVVDRVVPLQEAGEAQNYLETGAPRGKVILNIAA